MMFFLSTKRFAGDTTSDACYGRMNTFYHQPLCRGELRQICAQPISGLNENGNSAGGYIAEKQNDAKFKIEAADKVISRKADS